MRSIRRACTDWSFKRTPGTCRSCSSSIWSASGASPTRGSGRFAASGGTSSTRRSWRGWHSTGRCAPWRSRTIQGRSTAGARCATRSMRTSSRSGFDEELGSFVQSYGSKELDASLLLIPLVGFLPASDPRVRGTIEAIERSLARRRLRPAVPHARDRRRRPASRRGRLPAVLVLARRLPRAHRAARRRARAVRAAPRSRERRGAAGGGVRPEGEASARQLPAGVHAPRTRELGVQRASAPAVADASAARRLAVAEVVRGRQCAVHVRAFGQLARERRE